MIVKERIKTRKMKKKKKKQKIINKKKKKKKKTQGMKQDHKVVTNVKRKGKS